MIIESKNNLVIISNNWIKKNQNEYYGFPQWKFLEGFHKFFHKVYFLSPIFKIKSYHKNGEIGIKLTNNLVKIIELPYFSGTISQIKKIYLLVVLIPIYFKNIKKADIIFIFNRDFFSTIALFISKILNKKTVLFIGDIWGKSVEEKYKSVIFLLVVKLLTFFQKRILNLKKENSLIFITANKFIEYEVKTFGIDYYKYFASLVSEKDIYYKKLQPLIKKDIIYILYVGWLIEAKGVQDLIEAISLLQTEISSKINLHIVGDGYYRKILHNLSNEKKVEAFFYGFIGDRKKLKEIYRKCDIFVLPSYAEGYPKVVFEAASQGNLVITSDIVELDRICLKYKTKDIYALKKLLKKVINNYEVYKNQIEQQYKIIKNYTLEESCKDIYNKLKEKWFPENRND